MRHLGFRSMTMLAEEPALKQARQGMARLQVDVVDAASVATHAISRTPVKLLIPKARGPAVWACLSAFGGGMLAGDEAILQFSVSAHASCFVSTQSSTKIYTSPNGSLSRQTLHAEVGAGGLLAIVPDPVQCFAGSNYEQRQSFSMAASAGLVFVDALSAGRSARGERWAFQRFFSRTDVFIDGERAALDALLLDSTRPGPSPAETLGRFGCVAVVMIFGERFARAREALLSSIAAWPVAKRATLMASASPVKNGLILRFAGEQVEEVTAAIASHLHFLHEPLGDNPFARKW